MSEENTAESREITFVTKVDEQIMYAFNMYIMGKNRITAMILGAILVALGVVQIILDGLWFGIFLIVMGTAFVVFFACISVIIKRNIRKSDAINNQTAQTMTFDTDRISLLESGKYTVESKSSCTWERFIGAVETEKYFFLFVAKNQAMLVNKLDATEFAIKGLHNMLVEKYGKRFKFPKKLYR